MRPRKPTLEDVLKCAGLRAEQNTSTSAHLSFPRPLRSWNVLVTLKAGRLVMSAYVMRAPVGEPRQARFLERVKAINAEIGGDIFTVRNDLLTIETKHRVTYTDADLLGTVLRYVCDQGEKFYPSLLAIVAGQQPFE